MARLVFGEDVVAEPRAARERAPKEPKEPNRVSVMVRGSWVEEYRGESEVSGIGLLDARRLVAAVCAERGWEMTHTAVVLGREVAEFRVHRTAGGGRETGYIRVERERRR